MKLEGQTLKYNVYGEWQHINILCTFYSVDREEKCSEHSPFYPAPLFFKINAIALR